MHSANGALEFIDELLGRVEKEVCEVAAVRFDAGFPEEKLLAKLEERGTPYVARVRNTSVLQREAALPRFMNSGVPQGSRAPTCTNGSTRRRAGAVRGAWCW
ncbi:hypothetical protein JQX13_12855 [Archangium violaceum]|uniref:transposase n=1 Tax=Archangium violaceum TaxID=83451 RepID=UPI00193BA2B6|nr:transposase [Archangium violaceum]QRK08600.1 hypothetical protein JQX13_53435 [Archangium violaceum]QRK10876.1 hypothetical protein JQX13_12855 [Archangium violaceum]